MSVKVMSQVWEDSRPISKSELLVLLALADIASDNGKHIYPKISTLAAKVRMTERGVQKVLARLKSSGRLNQIKVGGRIDNVNTPNEWEIPITYEPVVIVVPVTVKDAGVNGIHPRGEQCSVGVNNVHHRGEPECKSGVNTVRANHPKEPSLEPLSPCSPPSSASFELKSDPPPKRDKTKPSSYDEVKAHVCGWLELTEDDAMWLWEKWLGNGFTNGNKAMKDWKATACQWKRQKDIFPSQKQSAQSNRFRS